MIFGWVSIDPSGSKTGHVYCRETHRTPEPPRSYECPIGAPLHTCKTRNSKIRRRISLDPRHFGQPREKGWNDFFEGRPPRFEVFLLTTDTAFASYDRQTAGDGLRSARNEVEFTPSPNPPIGGLGFLILILGGLGIPNPHFENRLKK